MRAESTLSYRQLRRRVRPARVATRIGRMDAGWLPIALRMLENLSITWGGAGHVIVPVGDAGDVHPDIWRLAQLYDADQWATYVNTLRGLQMADPERFDSWLTTEARRWARKHGGGIKQARKLLSAEHVMTDARGGWPPPDAFAERLRQRTGPAAEDGRLVFATYSADGEPGHHLVDVADLDPLPDRVRLLGTANLPLSLQALVATRTGALGPNQMKRLCDRGVSIETVLVEPDDLGLVLRLAWLGRAQSGRWALRHALARRLTGVDRPAPPYLEDEFLDTTPMALSRLGCSQFSRWHPRNDDLPLTVVVGDHVDDFAYALCLDRCGVPALWLPGEFVAGRDKLSRAVREILTECLADTGKRRDPDIPPVLRSLSLTADELARLRTRLLKTRWGSHLEIDLAEETKLPPYRIPALMDRERFDDPIDVPFTGESMATGCPVVLPSAVTAKDPWKLMWWIEVDAPGHSVPGRAALNKIAVAESTGWRAIARCGRDGISFFSHTMGFASAGSSIEQLLERPRLRLPSALTIFTSLAAEAGLKLVESPAGRFRRLTLDLWGGLEEFAADLADPGRRAVLQAWLSEKPSGTDPGLLTNSRRRFLNLDDVCTAGGLATAQARALVDHYLVLGALRRGLTLQCRHCRLMEWYEMNELGQSFECRRCRTPTLLAADAWKHLGDEPAFYYDLAEVAYQALRGNVQVPVAALAKIRDGSKSFLDHPEVELTDAAGSTTEVDLLAVVDGRIILGEAKTSDRLQQSKQAELAWLRRFRGIAEAMTVDEVVFATAANAWAVTRERIATVFAESEVMVRVLEGV